MKAFQLNKEKAAACLLYIIQVLNKQGIEIDKHKVYKILYFADQKHLATYGRPILGDIYLKMDYGPVPSFVKNLIDEPHRVEIEQIVEIYDKYKLKALAEPDLDEISENELELINESIEENKNLNFAQLVSKSHDSAYHSTNWVLDFFDIAKVKSTDINMLRFIQFQMNADNLILQ